MGIRRTSRQLPDRSFDTYATVTCDMCKKTDQNGNRLRVTVQRFDTLDIDKIIERATEAGWLLKMGFIPAGSVNPKTGAVVTRGHHTKHKCVCPKCRGVCGKQSGRA